MTFQEYIELLMTLPWEAQVLICSPLVSIPLILWLRPNLKDPDVHFYHTFTSKVNKQLRKAFWTQTNRTNVEVVYRNILEDAYRRLESRTGPPSNWYNMKSIDRALWAWLFTRIRDTNFK